MTQAEPHLEKGGELAGLWADTASNGATYDFVKKVREVAEIIQMEQRMKADPAYAKQLVAEARRNKEAE